MKRTIPAICCLLAAGAAWGDDRPGRVIDRAVAMVEGRVITQSDLEFEARVALVQSAGSAAAAIALSEDALRDALDLAIGTRLEASEADKLLAYPLEEGEVEAALDRFRLRFSSAAEFEAFLDRHEADVQALATVITRSLRAAKILDGKLKLRAQVTDVEVRRYYDAHARQLDAPFEELRGAIRQKLLGERLQELTRAELKQIRKGADVRLIAPWARPSAAPAGKVGAR